MRALALFIAAVAAPAVAADWLQFGFDPSHSGTNPAETALSRANVSQLRLLYSATLPARVDGAPVLLTNVGVAKKSRKDVLYMTLRNGTLIALDAATGNLLWSRYQAGSNACAASGGCFTTSSPAIDPGRQYVYSYALDGYVHKYRVTDGGEITGRGWPQLVSAKPDTEAASSALAFATAGDRKTYLYATISSAPWLPDFGGYDYQGHITAISLSTGRQITFNVTCSNQGSVHFVKNFPNPPVSAQPDCEKQYFTNNGQTLSAGDGGIWGRGGATYDPANDRIYVTTGNGMFDANNGGHDWSDSVLAFPAALTTARTAPLNSYTPVEYQSMMYYNTDLGSTSIVLVPAPAGSSRMHIGMQVGKDGYLRLIDLDIMSGAAGNTGGDLFVGSVAQGNEVKTQPLVWVNPATHAIMLVVANNFGISASEVFADAANGNLPALRAVGPPNWVNPGVPVAGSATSTGGTSPVLANGVLYYAGGSGVLALDPLTGSTLWNDASMGVADASTSTRFRKQSLIVVNGRVYVPDNNGTLWVYGL